jgi:hypothetical protein
MKTKHLFVVSLMTLCLWSCTDYSSFKTGTYDEWIKGKGLSVNVMFVSGAGLAISIRNNSNLTLPITPITTVGWFYKKWGSKPCDFTFGDFPMSTMIRLTLVVTMSNGQTYEIMADEKNPDLKIRPGEEVSLPPLNFWKEDRITDENTPAKKLLVYIGPEGSKNQESFLIKIAK